MDNKLCYKKWKEIFDADVCKVWNEEPIPVLRSLSVLFFCFNRELQNLQNSVESNVRSLRMLLENSSECALFSKDPEVEDDGKTKHSDNKFNLEYLDCTLSQSDKTVENISGSVIISDDDFPNCAAKVSNSPEIKKAHRQIHHKRRKKLQQRLKDSTTPSESIISEVKSSLNVSNEEKFNKDKSSKSFQFFSKFQPKTEGLLRQPQIALHSSPIFKQQTKSDDDLDGSMIQGTPVLQSKTQLRSLRQESNLKKRTAGQNKNLFIKRLCGSDIDFSKKNVCTESIKTSDNMCLTEMISYVNKDVLLDEIPSPQNNISLNSGMIEEDSIVSDIMTESLINNGNYNIPNGGGNNVEKSLNSILAEVQNVPVQLEAAPKVLGKQRTKLPGWSCKQCEDFYLQSGLNKEQIMELNKCSKHRGYFKPREDTLPGYWDMNLLTPDT